MRNTYPLLLTLLVTAGCLKPDLEPRFTPAWEPFDPSEPGWESTRKAQVVSDCQFHNLFSLPVPERNLSAEVAVATAIRSPQLDLYSSDVLRWIVQNGAADSEVIVHLGDANDLACEGEFREFIDVMDSAGKPWFMTPGNHDCFYFGVYEPEKHGQWAEACNGAGRPLTKDLLLRLYLASLVRRHDPDSDALAEVLGLTAVRDEPLDQLAALIPATFAWERVPGEYDFLEALWWKIDVERPWRSYVLQSIDLSAAGARLQSKLLLLDSCQYSRRPELIPNGWRSYPPSLNTGSGGEMLPDQLRLARAWIEARPAHYTLAFHHPFDRLAPRSRASIGWIRRERPANLVLTGHTHRGYYAYEDVGGDEAELELNIGSTTDWPMEWRVVSGSVNYDEQQAYIVAERHTLVDELANKEGFFLKGWEIPLHAPDDYRRYKQGEPATSVFFSYYLAFHLTPYWLPQPRVDAPRPAWRTEEQVKDTLLWTYLRLIDYFPTDPSRSQPHWPEGCASDEDVAARIEQTADLEGEIEAKIALLIELRAFERSRSTWNPETREPTDGERGHYKVSQAAWASRFESSQGRRLRLEDEVMRIDWQKAARREERLERKPDGGR